MTSKRAVPTRGSEETGEPERVASQTYEPMSVPPAKWFVSQSEGLAPRPGLEPGTLRLTVARPPFAMDCDTVRLCSIHAPSVKVEPLSGVGWFATVFD